jgi:N-succinyldiaminopimelate aminotransferase
MNPRLDLLHAYPFERLRALNAGVIPPASLASINLGIGEPRHATPEIVKRALVDHLDGLASYPATQGAAALRGAIRAWLGRRYDVVVDPETQVLPVNGSREALFALAQTVVDSSRADATVVCPDPFYQIYEGAALLAGARVEFAATLPDAGSRGGFRTRWEDIADDVWGRTQLLYLCSPGNPAGEVTSLDEWRRLFALSDEHGFVIAADECYSEIYTGDEAPLGALEAARRLGRGDFRRLVSLTSLSKRSNVPGMRSGFVAGDAAVIKQFLRYRTYHGSAMSPPVQQASIAAWNDEDHVLANRALYRAKFARVTPMLASVLDVHAPEAGFYLWAKVPGGDDASFARALLAQYNVTALPGSLLGRDVRGMNPGAGRIRLALVAGLDECVEAAERIVSCVRTHAT